MKTALLTRLNEIIIVYCEDFTKRINILCDKMLDIQAPSHSSCEKRVRLSVGILFVRTEQRNSHQTDFHEIY